MAAHPVKIVHASDQAWAKSPRTPGRTGIIDFSNDSAPCEHWVADFSQGPQKVTIQNIESGLYAYFNGRQVITISASVVPREHLYWEVRLTGKHYTIQIPNQNLYWDVRDGKILLASANPGRQYFAFNE